MAVSKLSFFFTTLIAAVPAAFLGYLCVAAFLFHSDALPPILMGIAGITLLLCVAVVATPVYVLIKSSGRTTPAAEKEPEAKSDDEEGDVVVSDDEPVASDDEGDVFVEDEDDEFGK
jgi:hypothetical protein